MICLVVDVEGKYVKQLGGCGQYGYVKLKIELILDMEEDFIFEEMIYGGLVLKDYFFVIEKGCCQQFEFGVLVGYLMLGVKVNLYDGLFYEVDFNENVFCMVGVMVVKKGCFEVRLVLFEFIMKVEVVILEDYMGDVMGDLNWRCGILQGMDDVNGVCLVNVEVFLLEMFGYVIDLCGMFQGWVIFIMEFLKYVEVF